MSNGKNNDVSALVKQDDQAEPAEDQPEKSERTDDIYTFKEGETPRQFKDRFFRASLQNPDVARGMIEAQLPTELTAQCQWNTLKMESASAYTNTLREQMVDAILSVKMSKDRHLHLIVHVEHLSAPKRWITLDFRRFRNQYYHDLVHNQKVKKLPLVYPVLVYHHEKCFPYSNDFYDLFEDAALARKYLDKPLDIVNVCDAPDDEAETNPYAAFLKLTMKYTAVHTNFEEALSKILVPMVRKLYQQNPQGFKKSVSNFVQYVFASAPFTSKEKLANIINEIDNESGGTMLSLAEHIKEESLAQGINQGVQQGMQQGKRDLLVAMLQKGRSPREVASLTGQPLATVEALWQLI